MQYHGYAGTIVGIIRTGTVRTQEGGAGNFIKKHKNFEKKIDEKSMPARSSCGLPNTHSPSKEGVGISFSSGNVRLPRKVLKNIIF